MKASFHRKYLQGRLQVPAGMVASTCGDGCKYLRGGLHVLAWTDAVHCVEGCSALRGNHPKRADFYMTFLLVNFAVKNAMFNLNENNRFVMAQYPSDMRIGVNGMCGQVRAVGLDPTNGDVYIFVGMSRKIMKLLHWERGGFAMYYKRLEKGRFHPRIFLRQGIGFRSMRWDELVLLMEGISPKVARRHRYVIEEKTASEEENNRQNIWLSR